MAGAGRPPTTLLRPTLQVVDASPAMTMELSASPQPIRLFPDGSFRHGGRRAPPSTPSSVYFGKRRGQAFAHHDVVGTAVSPTCYFKAHEARACHDEVKWPCLL